MKFLRRLIIKSLYIIDILRKLGSNICVLRSTKYIITEKASL